MTKEVMEKLQLQSLLWQTPTVLQMADRSTVQPEGILEDVIVSIDSWEYPADFMVLHTKTSLGREPLILGRPWLATVYAYIGCCSGDMTISQGNSVKILTLYPPAKKVLDLEEHVWMSLEELDFSNDTPMWPVLTIDRALTLKKPIDDQVILNYMQNWYPTTVQIRETDCHTEGEASSSFNPEVSIIPPICHNTASMHLDDYFVATVTDLKVVVV